MQSADVGPARPDLADGARDARCFLGLLLEIEGDLGDAVDRHRQRDELDAVGEPGLAEGEAADAGIDVGAGEPSSRPSTTMRDRLDHRAARQHDRGDQAAHHQREIFRRAELQRDGGERRRREADQQGRDAAGEERADARRCRAPARRGPAAPSAWPSRVVTTDEASPGMLTRIAVVEPPYCAP